MLKLDYFSGVGTCIEIPQTWSFCFLLFFKEKQIKTKELKCKSCLGEIKDGT